MNNDLISREALKKALELTDYNDIYDLTITERLIDNAPTVTPDMAQALAYESGKASAERPQGEWAVGYTAKQKKVSVCNLCNRISFQGKTNFCHNCGAAMRKGGAENGR